MFTVQPITKDQAQTFIRTHKLSLFYNEGYEDTEYEFVYGDPTYIWYGVFDGDRMVALQVAEELSNGEIDLMCLQKIEGVGHGVFESVMNYLSNHTLYLRAYDKKLQKMYESLGFTKIDNYKFVK